MTPSEAWSRFPTGVGFDPNRPNWFIVQDAATGGMSPMLLDFEPCGAVLYATYFEALQAIDSYDSEAPTKKHPMLDMIPEGLEAGKSYIAIVCGEVAVRTFATWEILGAFYMPRKDAEALAETFRSILSERQV